MRERDLERATQLFADVKICEGRIQEHSAFKKELRLHFELIDQQTETSNWVPVHMGLDINEDELHARVNLVVAAMLKEKLGGYKTELRKLGLKLEDEEPKPKAQPKMKQLPAPKGDTK